VASVQEAADQRREAHTHADELAAQRDGLQVRVIYITFIIQGYLAFADNLPYDVKSTM
jgi:hypothetical protein